MCCFVTVGHENVTLSLWFLIDTIPLI